MESRKAARVRMASFLAWKDASAQVDSEQLSHCQFSLPICDLRGTVVKILVGKCILQAPFVAQNAVKGSVNHISTNCIFLFYYIASFFSALRSVFVLFWCLADFFKNIRTFYAVLCNCIARCLTLQFCACPWSLLQLENTKKTWKWNIK